MTVPMYDPMHQPAPPWAVTPPPTPPRRKLPAIAAVAVVIGVIIVVTIAVGLAVRGTTHQPASPTGSAFNPVATLGFNDPEVLAAEVKRTTQESLDEDGTDMTLNSVICVQSSPRHFTCKASTTEGIYVNERYLVSADGKTYIAVGESH